jgi:hypothetical protein
MDHRFTHAGIKRATLSSSDREHMFVSGNPDVISEATSLPGRGIGANKSPFASSHKGSWDATGASVPDDTYGGLAPGNRRGDPPKRNRP